MFKQLSGCREAGIASSCQIPGILNLAFLRLFGFLLILKKYVCDFSFCYANPLPLRSIESERNMAGTGYRESLLELLLNLKVSGTKSCCKCLIARPSDCVLGTLPTLLGQKENEIPRTYLKL